jgi:hypothetical protein
MHAGENWIGHQETLVLLAISLLFVSLIIKICFVYFGKVFLRCIMAMISVAAFFVS